jgi:hypothetical protein
MPRKLKTFVTSAGFFDLAVATPSMKAALAAWGADSDLFHQGFARQTDDAAIVAATQAKPGVVLRRPVGTTRDFAETAEISERALVGAAASRPKATRGTKRGKPKRGGDEAARRPAPPRKATGGSDRKQQERQRAREKREEQARVREEERRAKEVAAAEAALGHAKAEHERRVAALDRERASLDRRASAEEKDWAREAERLREALRRARR